MPVIFHATCDILDSLETSRAINRATQHMRGVPYESGLGYIEGSSPPHYPVPAMRIRAGIVHYPANETNFMVLTQNRGAGHWFAIGLGKYHP